MVIRKSRQASKGRATRNTTASSRLIEKATAVFVTSLVSLVTREETRKWSMLEKEYF